ncbi:MAG: endonuclease/exonuclease/phosphatase family protein [Planctomycetota bacterium]|nr:endonuclease/exonuclease/phosphatase family protein [Planctomycetota bacterium]
MLATHLDHRRDDQERIASAKAINKLLRSESGRPALLAGDLNDVVGSETLREFDAVWMRSNIEPLPTIPVTSPSHQIDFILFSPQEHWQVIEVKVLDEAVASDHRAIFAVLEFMPIRANESNAVN